MLIWLKEVKISVNMSTLTRVQKSYYVACFITSSCARQGNIIHCSLRQNGRPDSMKLVCVWTSQWCGKIDVIICAQVTVLCYIWRCMWFLSYSLAWENRHAVWVVAMATEICPDHCFPSFFSSFCSVKSPVETHVMWCCMLTAVQAAPQSTKSNSIKISEITLVCFVSRAGDLIWS